MGFLFKILKFYPKLLPRPKNKFTSNKRYAKNRRKLIFLGKTVEILIGKSIKIAFAQSDSQKFLKDTSYSCMSYFETILNKFG